MNAIGTSILTAVIMILLLRSEVTPWRIVSQNELDQLNQRLAAATAAAAAAAAANRPAQPHAPAQAQSGAWMRDPNRHTPFDSAGGLGGPQQPPTGRH